MAEPGQITQLITEWKNGEEAAEKELFELLYEELREMARRQRRGMRGAAETINTTAVIHEVYLKFHSAGGIAANDRTHFMIIASRAMRQILINYAIRRKRQKRGGGAPKVTFGPEAERQALVEEQGERLLDIDRALTRLQSLHERVGQVVELRFFGGLTYEEIAEALGVGRTTVTRDWAFAKAWLQAELEELREGASGREASEEAP